MKRRDHDYAGKERRHHQMKIHAEFDGELVWLWLDGVHSWEDGTYVHKWTHALPPETLYAILRCAENAMYVYEYSTTILPQLVKEIGCLEYLDELYGLSVASEEEQCSY